MTAAMPELPPEVLDPEADEPSDPEFTIDELAALTRVPSRTIRFYQSKKALPPPERRGRKAVYSESHAERLRLIARLQDQGLTIKAIRDVLHRADKGELVLTDWLGLKDQMQTPWADDTPRVVSRSELLDLVQDDRDGLIADLVRLGVVARAGDAFSVASPGLLRVTMDLERAGIGLEASVEAGKVLRKHLGRAAVDVSKHFLTHLRRTGGESPATRVAEAFGTLRPVGLEAVRLIFAQEMERALRSLVESGHATDVARHS